MCMRAIVSILSSSLSISYLGPCSGWFVFVLFPQRRNSFHMLFRMLSPFLYRWFMIFSLIWLIIFLAFRMSGG